jgi:hypothetical protein
MLSLALYRLFFVLLGLAVMAPSLARADDGSVRALGQLIEKVSTTKHRVEHGGSAVGQAERESETGMPRADDQVRQRRAAIQDAIDRYEHARATINALLDRLVFELRHSKTPIKVDAFSQSITDVDTALIRFSTALTKLESGSPVGVWQEIGKAIADAIAGEMAGESVREIFSRIGSPQPNHREEAATKLEELKVRSYSSVRMLRSL